MECMQQNNQGHKPFENLGNELKHIRQAAQESLAEASGAVEIELDTLAGFERGEARPSEDILMLLITHFNIEDDAASYLWKLAGYDPNRLFNTSAATTDEPNFAQQPAIMLLPLDARVVYTDMAHVVVNNYGVVMNFLQSAANNAQPLAVARVGMSLDHAKSVVDLLQQAIEQASRPAQKRALPAPKKVEDPKNTKDQSQSSS
jgi:transcriptional regulator with XRE-family HTH domain